jgi:hypothetical protein
MFLRPDASSWHADVSIKGERRRRRWSTGVINDGDGSMEEAERRAREHIASGQLKPLKRSKRRKWRVPILVYFIQAENGLIKIGRTTDLPARLATMRTDSPIDIRLLASFIGSIGAEKELHQRFSHLRVRGEWFKAEADLLEYIKSTTTPPPPPSPAP